MGVSGRRDAPAPLYPWKRALGTYRTGGAGLAPEPVWTQMLEEEFFRLCQGLNPGRPVRSQTLHWLSYPAK
jgi:hypothetical protein